jgi:hypothetical protein
MSSTPCPVQDTKIRDRPVDLEGSAHPGSVSSSLRDCGVDPDPLGAHPGAASSDIDQNNLLCNDLTESPKAKPKISI